MIMLQPDRLGVHQKASDGCPTCPFFLRFSTRTPLVAFSGNKYYNGFEEKIAVGIQIVRKEGKAQ